MTDKRVQYLGTGRNIERLWTLGIGEAISPYSGHYVENCREDTYGDHPHPRLILDGERLQPGEWLVEIGGNYVRERDAYASGR